jgi:hypothetical protein
MKFRNHPNLAKRNVRRSQAKPKLAKGIAFAARAKSS